MSNGSGAGERRVPESMRKQLAVAVRSIQWSYAIFWSLSPTQQGVLEWGDGYYNGDIKTRKTVQAGELIADKVGLQRSEQLRKLYEALQEGESEHQQSKRPSASLSPEDLTDEEWYYLVCMSFVFNPGEGLPGRALANGHTIWLCNAQYADSKIFPRSLLAKSASIQTVVCFPYPGGVIELGVTELVEEDPSLLERIKVALLNLSKPLCPEKPSFVQQNGDHEKDAMTIKADNNNNIADALVFENLFSSTERINFDQETPAEPLEMDLTADSLDECSNECEHNQETEDSFMVDGVNGASQVQSWHFFEDDFSNGFQCSMNSSDCISEAVVNPENRNPGNYKSQNLKEVQECNHSKLGSLDLGTDDDNDVLHYKRTVSAILGNTLPPNETRVLRRCCGCKSSFASWKVLDRKKIIPQEQQKLLKTMLFKVPRMFEHCQVKNEHEKDAKGCVVLDKKKENEKFLLLRSMVPSIHEIDKASILSDTILYLKELEARVEELESCMDTTDFDGRPPRRKILDTGEQTSDNYENRKSNEGKKHLLVNKRKACDIDVAENPDFNQAAIVPRECQPLDLKVHIKDREVLIEMRCPYREYLLLDVMEAVNNLHLDAHSIQSSTCDGILALTLKSKFRGAAISPAGMIKQALRKIMGNC